MPKVTTFRKFQYRARLFNHRDIPVPGNPPTTAKEYFYVRDIAFDITQGVFGRLTIFLPESSTDVMQNARLSEVRDTQGNEIYPGGVWALGDVMPGFYLGRREGFQARLTLVGQTGVVV